MSLLRYSRVVGAICGFICLPVQASKLPDEIKLIHAGVFFGSSLHVVRSQKYIPNIREQEFDEAFQGLESEKEELFLRASELQKQIEVIESERKKLKLEHEHNLTLLEGERDLFRKQKATSETILDNRATKLADEFMQAMSELEEREKLSKAQIKAEIEPKIQKAISDNENLKLHYSEQFEQLNARHEHELIQWKQRVNDLSQLLQLAQAPKMASGGDEITANYCNKFIRYSWSHEPKIKIDCAARQPQDQGNKDVFWVELRDSSQLKELKALADELQLEFGKNDKPVIVQEYGESTIRVELPRNQQKYVHKEVLKASFEDKLFDLAEMKDAKRGFLISGHPGSGKTSSLIYLAQLIGGDDAQRLALNPHLDETSDYSKYGFIEINDMQAIIEQIHLLEQELKLRMEDKARRFQLIVVIDEFGRVLDSVELPKEISEIVRHISVEGRKFNMSVFVGNHSTNTNAILMDAQYRASFYQVFLVGAARDLSARPGFNHEWRKWESEWLRECAYPAILLTNGQYKLAKHPTHSAYENYRDSGNVPQNLAQLTPNNLSIELAPTFLADNNIIVRTLHKLAGTESLGDPHRADCGNVHQDRQSTKTAKNTVSPPTAKTTNPANNDEYRIERYQRFMSNWRAENGEKKAPLNQIVRFVWSDIELGKQDSEKFKKYRAELKRLTGE